MRKLLKRVAYGLSALAILILPHFPFDVDQPPDRAETEKTRQYYADAYKQGPSGPEASPSAAETTYLDVATEMAKTFDIEGLVRGFVEKYEMKDKRVLDIGSGRGYLQDVVEDYTGLDISSNVARFYHKKFVMGSATAMPFEDDAFDGVMSVWVQEHVPNPEQFLREARRVVKNNGVIFLYTSWLCAPWAAQGYQVRPYSDFNFAGKVIKATIPIRAIAWEAAVVPVRTVRSLSAYWGPSTLHYKRLVPNYEVYWQSDGDAINSIDVYEAMLWFTTRGDECLSCSSPRGSVLVRFAPLIIRVHK